MAISIWRDPSGTMPMTPRVVCAVSIPVITASWLNFLAAFDLLAWLQIGALSGRRCGQRDLSRFLNGVHIRKIAVFERRSSEK
ncbi:MAG: hypothetical protein E5V49_07080 [Mesorhizobium sp.]|nr:hypothetical protein EN848_26355 [bacterium M00.F.Ca.ET.205.01.1.1]TGU48458.1 hypothetical protein EN795_27635 [bacterium M00.F.Ca.ET.152.01.1.1]TGV32716.1 hypothetical protein EN829_027180 [Mesorhizobium sp. M00.F.Ca.ET.186.01.1.1]TGZ39974.1 hypothetical protein EN805_27030 [bacterium M00.F.Ca.ET.162.01.1.1]TJW33667.1 MAG: hypothetical protein E5V49_07080 [Mesorhizobium sp.]